MKGMIPSSLIVILLTCCVVSAQADHPCDLLDDPFQRGMMSGPFELHLMERCGMEPIFVQQNWENYISGAKEIANGPDVQVNGPDTGETTYITQSECVVAVNEDGTLAAGWNDSTHYYTGDTTSFTGYGYSIDGGAAWTDGGPIDGGALGDPRGDPDVNVDADGNFWYSCMVSPSVYELELMVAKSTDGGATYGTPVSAHSGGYDDKVLTAIDATGGAKDGNIYVCWKNFGEFDFNLYCVTSTNGGTSFGSQVNICPTCGSEGSQAPFPVVAPNGDLYVTWLKMESSVQIKLSKSTNGGVSFSETTAPTADFEASRNDAASISCGRNALKGPLRYGDFPSMAIDPDGTVHIAYSQNGAGNDDADVMYVKSEDGGTTWTTPYKLNDDATARDQFFPTIVSNPAGVLTAYWYDRRDHLLNEKFKIYKSRSLDGGDTWSDNEAVSDEQSPVWSGSETATCYMGDYNKGAADLDNVYIIWSDNRNWTGGHPDPDVWFEAQPVCDNADAAVSFDPPDGEYYIAKAPLEVQLVWEGDDPLCPEDGPLYYTTDGTDPTTGSDLYTAAIEITEATEVKVLPFTCCQQELPIASASYVICTDEDPEHCGEDCVICGAGESCVSGECVTESDDDDTTDDDATDDDATDDDASDDDAADDDAADDDVSEDDDDDDDDDDEGCCG